MTSGGRGQESTALRLGVVADIHHGEDIKTKLGSRALPLLHRFLAHCQAQAVQFVVDLGDRINNPAFRGPDGDAVSDRAHMQDVGRVFRETAIPRHHVTGNHDVLYLDREANAAALGYPTGSRVTRVGGVDLVLWDACVEPSEAGVALNHEDLNWLESALASVPGPAVVCSHIPLDNGSMIGNHYFEGLYRRYGTYANGAEARAIIERSDRVVLCLAGHTHWFALNFIRGIAYVTIPSLTESCDTDGVAEGAFAVIDIGRRIAMRIYGRRELSLSWPIRRTFRR